MRTVQTSVLALAVAILLGGANPVLSDEPEVGGDGYGEGNFGRVRTLDPAATLLRSESSGNAGLSVRADLNAPIFPGDTLLTSRNERAEVQLAGGALIRIDAESSITFLSLPDSQVDVADNTVLKLASGNVRIAARASSDSEFRIDTPAASVYLLGDADLRVEVEPGGSARVISRRGVAEVVGEGGSVLVRGGTRSRVEPGTLPDPPQPFNTFTEDAFDAWTAALDDENRERRRGSDEANSVAYEQLPAEVRPYYSELSGYGRWVQLPSYGYAWVPAGGAAFRPYVNGYWSYGSGGYFWVSYEPWGWAPYHYGRWTWAVGNGWCWLPGRVFAGAWVSWSWGPTYVGWCPLDYWNRPCYYGPRRYGYYDPHCWTVVNATQLTHRGGYHRTAVPFDRAETALARNAVVTRPPRVAPDVIASDSAARQRAVRQVEADGRFHVRPETGTSVPSRRAFRESERDDLRVLAPAPGSRGALRTRADVSPAPNSSSQPQVRRRTVTAPRPTPDVESRNPRSVTPRRTIVPNSPAGEREATPDRRRTVARRQPVDESNDAPVRARAPAPAPSERRRATPPTNRIAPQSGDAIREMYRRVAPPRATRSEPQTTEPQTRSAAPQSEPSKPAPSARGGTRAESPKQEAPAKGSRSSGSRGQGGNRGNGRRR